MKLAIVGLGAIGWTVAHAVLDGQTPGVRLAGAVEPRSEASLTLQARGVPVAASLAGLPEQPIDVVLEAASQETLREIAAETLTAGRDLIALSVGALLDAAWLSGLLETAAANGRRIWLPSGAIGGLDVLRAAATGDLDSLQLTTTKPPAAFAGTPYLLERGIDPAEIKTRTELFHGAAAAAVRAFPRNVNVAALLTLAAGRPEVLTVTIVADPAVSANTHEVRAQGSFGRLELRLENAPAAANPKTSALAAQSVVALLRRLGSPLQVGG